MTPQAKIVHRLFTVSLPGISDYRFGLPAEQVVTIVEKPRVYSLPLLPTAARGLVRYGGTLITLLDLPALLGEAPAPSAITHALVITTTARGKPERVAWPVTAQAAFIRAPTYLPTVQSPLTGHPLVAAVVSLVGEAPLALLDLTRLDDVIKSTHQYPNEARL